MTRSIQAPTPAPLLSLDDRGVDRGPTRRSVIAGGVAAAALSSGETGAALPKLPNIIFIMADDLGFADLSCFGRRDYETPVLDGLARRGVRFTSAYSNSPVCSATRTALMTGRYQYRLPVGLEEPLSIRDVGLSPTEPTLASSLRAAGYATALVGKWHLGALPRFSPLKSGYETFWGFRGGGVDYFSHRLGKTEDLWDGDVPIERVGYMTDLLADRAIGVIEDAARSRRPFLLSLHFSAPHWPWEAPGDQAESARIGKDAKASSIFHYDGGTLATYAAMVTRMDEQIGRLLATLDRLNLRDDTIVIFTSDNGGERFSDTWPFSGRKTELLEGGIRVPAILSWPRRVAPAICDKPVMTMDWMPTLLTAAGAPPARGAASDGISIWSDSGVDAPDDRPLFWRYKALDQRACRTGRYKYLRINGNEFLFDIVADPLERANLKARDTATFRHLRANWEAWNAGMLAYDAEVRSASSSAADAADRMGLGPSPQR